MTNVKLPAGREDRLDITCASAVNPKPARRHVTGWATFDGGL